MKILKRISIVLAGLLLVIQFVRPSRNTAGDNPTNDISAIISIPEDVRHTLRTSCYDCHSNTTRYPWYAEVQPVAWWLNSHIKEAKRELNFSEFAGYGLRRRYIKLQQLIDQVSENEMPLPSYLLIHTDARVSENQKSALIGWANSTRASMRAMYPSDSLERRRTL